MVLCQYYEFRNGETYLGTPDEIPLFSNHSDLPCLLLAQ